MEASENMYFLISWGSPERGRLKLDGIYERVWKPVPSASSAY